MNKYILIFALLLLPLHLFAQSVTIKGVVVDDMGEVVIGVRVSEVENPTNGTSSDQNGVFTLSVKSNTSQIRINYLGYRTQTLTVTPNQEMKIVIEPEVTMLTEVVTVGYAKQKRLTTSGSIAEITSAELKQSPSASIQNALVGRLPGLFQQQTSGQPGADAANIYIRGIGTFASVDKSPLVMIDDIESDYSSLTSMDPNEVETISILKDASSTAIFGVKGANGVILVSTKRGKLGKPRISYKAEFGIQSPTVYNRTLGSYDALKVLEEYYENIQPGSAITEMPSYLNPEALEHFRKGDLPHLYPDVNWYDAIMRNHAPQMRHNIDIRGGTESVKYFVSFGYFDQDGILKEIKRKENFNGNYYLKRYNLRSNFDIQVTRDLKLAVNVSSTLSERNELHNTEPRVTGGAWPLWRTMASGMLPPYIFPEKYEDGSYAGVTGYGMNPLMKLEYAGYRRQFRNNINGNMSAEYDLDKLVSGLKIKGTMAITNSWGYSRSLTRDQFPDYVYNYATDQLERVVPGVDPLPPLTVNASTTTAPVIAPIRKITSQLILTYGKSLGDHNVSALGLMNWDTYKSGSGDPANFQGISGRIAYDYRSKYMIEFNAGYNGSDRFKAKNKYGFFPAVSGGWNIGEEEFLENILESIQLNQFKIRGSYGLVGSDAFDSSNRYIYNSVYTRNTTANHTYYFGENPYAIATIWPGALGNDDVRWEKERKLDIGADIRFLNSRLMMTFEYFKNNRYDILTSRATIPSLAGITSPPVNMGRVENKGWEVEAQWRDQIGKLSYFLKGNISTAKNKILEIDEAVDQYPLRAKTGHPVSQIYGYIWDGYYQSLEELANLPDKRANLKPGDLKYKDISGPDGTPDGRIDDYDWGPIGNPSIPQLTYGFSVGGSYNKFDFSVLFQGASKGSLMSNSVLQVGNLNGRPREVHQDAWREDNRNPSFPRLGGPNFDNSTFWLRSNSYLRIKNVELGYTVPSSITNKLNINSLRVFANGLNLFTWSKLKIYDVDPESSSANANAAYSDYPQMKVFNFGLQVEF